MKPYNLAVRRRFITVLMRDHKMSRKEALSKWDSLTDEQITKASVKYGVTPSQFDGLNINSIFDWISNNWGTILQVALSLVSIVLMLVKEEEKKNVHVDE